MRITSIIRPATAAAALLLAAGCSASPRTPAPTAPSTTPPSASATTPVAMPAPVSPADPLPVPGKVVYQAAAQYASAKTVTLPELQPGAVGITAACSGPGSIKVALSGILSYTVTCDSSGPSDYNDYQLNAPRSSVSLSVQATAGDEWAVTVDWSAPAANPNPTD